MSPFYHKVGKLCSSVERMFFSASTARLTRVAAEKAGKNEELRTTIAIFASADGGNAVFWAVGAVPTGCWNYQPYAKVVPVSTPVD